MHASVNPTEFRFQSAFRFANLTEKPLWHGHAGCNVPLLKGPYSTRPVTLHRGGQDVSHHHTPSGPVRPGRLFQSSSPEPDDGRSAGRRMERGDARVRSEEHT